MQLTHEHFWDHQYTIPLYNGETIRYGILMYPLVMTNIAMV